MDKSSDYEWQDPEWRACKYRTPEYISYLKERPAEARHSRHNRLNEDYRDRSSENRQSAERNGPKSIAKQNRKQRASSLATGARNTNTRSTNAIDFRNLYYTSSKPYQRLSIPRKNVKVVEIDEQYTDSPDFNNASKSKNGSLRRSTYNRENNEDSEPKKPFVDTIISYDQKQKNLRIENIVKIGRKIITKKWDWDTENDGEDIEDEDDTNEYDQNSRSSIIGSKNLFNEPTRNNRSKRGTNSFINSLTRYDHEAWELWFKDKDVFVDDVDNESSLINKPNTRK